MSLYSIVDHPIINKTAIASTLIPAKTNILVFGNGPEDVILSSPNMHSVQLGFDRHLDSFTDARFAPHSSNPNSRLAAIIDFETLAELPEGGDVNLVIGYAIQSVVDIPKGTEISWNYNSSEITVTCSFTDLYTNNSITGFMNLSSTQQRSLLPLASPFIRQEYTKRFLAQVTTVQQPIVGEVLVAAESLPAGTIVGAYGDNLGDELISAPNMHSVQISETRHVLSKTHARFASHSSAAPSCELVPYTTLFNGCLKELTHEEVAKMISSGIEVPVDGLWLRTAKNVAAGDALSFDYCSSEWDMACGFDDSETGLPCRGFKYLPSDIQTALLAKASPFIQKQYHNWVQRISDDFCGKSTQAPQSMCAPSPAPVPMSSPTVAPEAMLGSVDFFQMSPQSASLIAQE